MAGEGKGANRGGGGIPGLVQAFLVWDGVTCSWRDGDGEGTARHT
jgi:hypothetical protein